MNGAENPDVTVAAATRVWARIGLLSFGGPAAQIGLMHKEIVESRGWLSEKQFLNATGFCMLLPGPEAMQIATYAGWRLHGVFGGLIAGSLFVLPGAMVILLLAALYLSFGAVPAVNAIFVGVQAAVISIVIGALLGLSKRALTGAMAWTLAVFGFLALFVLNLPFPLVILCAAALGAVSARSERETFTEPVSLKSNLAFTMVIWLCIWGAPLALLWLFDPGGILLQIGLFFSKLAVVTFGGAYAVLAYMSQQVVTDFGWLSAAQMMDGLGLAETTPGPLILVTEFVGFVAGFGAGSWGLGLAAAVLTLWVTFVPCFLWIFAAAPYVEWIAAQPRLKGALDGITAAVVGVIANLSLWFALHVLFGEVRQVDVSWASPWVPELTSMDVVALALTAVSLAMYFIAKRPLLQVLSICAALALGINLAGL
ncbi:MAG: chromate efflux transporter [Pseudomonadota bacterium]